MAGMPKQTAARRAPPAGNPSIVRSIRLSLTRRNRKPQVCEQVVFFKPVSDLVETSIVRRI